MRTRRILRLLAVTLLVSIGSGAAAAGEPVIGELSQLDRQWMAGQRAMLEDLARRHFGRGFNGEADNDLPLLQQLLDRRLVREDQTRRRN